MSSEETIVQLDRVTLRYGTTSILQNLQLDLKRNHLLALTGSSGSGKSTLLRTLCRMNDRTKGFSVNGKVRVLGQDIYERGVDVYELRRRVGMVFQKPCLFPGSVYHNVIFGMRHHAPSRKQEFPELVEQVLKKSFLWKEVKDRLDAPAQTLSQGQQQRLSIARTLLLDPEVLLMDEPTSALDSISTLAIEDLILTLKKSHTILLVTHSKKQAQRLSDFQMHLPAGLMDLTPGSQSPLKAGGNTL